MTDAVPGANGRAKCWAIIPAAGIGTRMNAEVPKQYLALLDGRPVLAHTLERFVAHPTIVGVVVVLALSDRHWEGFEIARHNKIIVADGGTERCHSVVSGLKTLSELANDHDWVLVHDAARPCLRVSDIDRLLTELSDQPVGGILALPVRDTMKRANDLQEIAGTVERTRLWHALTPQMFRYGLLLEALQLALNNQLLVTDEAQAVELQGHHPLLVEGQADNIKITRPQDLALAELFLRQQQAESV